MTADAVRRLRFATTGWRVKIDYGHLAPLASKCALIDTRKLNFHGSDGLFLYSSWDEEKECPVISYTALDTDGTIWPLRSRLYLAKRTIRGSRRYSTFHHASRPTGYYSGPVDLGIASDINLERRQDRVFGEWCDRIIALVCSGVLVLRPSTARTNENHFELLTQEEADIIDADRLAASADFNEPSDGRLIEHTRPENAKALKANATLETIPCEHALKQAEREPPSLSALYDQLVESSDKTIADLEQQTSTLSYRLCKSEEKAKTLEFEIKQLAQRASIIDDLSLPSSPAESLELAIKAYPDRLIALSEAYRSAREFSGGSTSETWEALRCMATILHPLVFASDESRDIRRAFDDASGFHLALTDGMMTNKNPRLKQMRLVNYDGKEIDVTAHIKGKSRRSGTTLRIHFYTDHDKQLLVIGHCGGHLPTHTYADRS